MIVSGLSAKDIGALSGPTTPRRRGFLENTLIGRVKENQQYVSCSLKPRIAVLRYKARFRHEPHSGATLMPKPAVDSRRPSAALAAAALIVLACLPATRAEDAAPTRTFLTDSFDSPQLNTTVWSPFFFGTARVPLPSEDATCGAPVNGRGAFVLQASGCHLGYRVGRVN